MEEIIGKLSRLIIELPIFIVAIAIHEFSHVLAADLLGDKTGREMGRLTLNPLSHIDWFGLFMLVIAHFGWGNPAPVNPSRFKNVSEKVGMAIVAVSGPLSNIILAIIGLYGLKLFGILHSSNIIEVDPSSIVSWFYIFIYINIMLFVFNLIPIPPLDGSRVVRLFLIGETLRKFDEFEKYGIIILMIILFIPFTNEILSDGLKVVIKLCFNLLLFLP